MKPSKCILFSRDQSLWKRVSGLLGQTSEVVWVSDGSEFAVSLEQLAPAIIWFDILNPDWRARLSEIREDFPTSLVILLGDDRSDPVIQAEGEGVFHVESSHCPRKRFQQVFRMAEKHLRVLQEREVYRQRAEKVEQADPVAGGKHGPSEVGGGALREGLGSFTKIDDLEELLARSLRFIKDYHTIGSLGVFLSDDGSSSFKPRATVKCPREVAALEFSENSPLVRWLRLHPSVIDHRAVAELEKENIALAHDLRKGLKQMFADAVLPLYGSRDLLGWLFVGRITFGNVIRPSEIASLSGTVDQLAFSVENCILHAQNTRQRAQFESILNALSIGIVLFDSSYRLLWVNDAASQISGRRCDELVNQPCKVLGSELAAMILENDPRRGEIATFTWSPANSEREYLAEVHGADVDASNPCGFLFLQDFTADGADTMTASPLEKVSNLVSSISTELRGPLVAIQSFIQLLPERYRDADFREQFIDLVSGEIGRLENLSRELDEVRVTPKGGATETVDATDILHRAVERASDLGVIDRADVSVTGEPGFLFKVVHTESLVESLSAILALLGFDFGSGESGRIWVETYVERCDLGESLCVYSFRGEGGAVIAGELGGTPGGGTPGGGSEAVLLGGGELDWASLKTRVATLGGKVNYGYNKKRSFITLQLPLN